MLAVSFIGYLIALVVLAWGLSHSMPHLEAFFLNNRSLSKGWAAIATVAAWFGAGSILATMDQTYQTGVSAAWLIAIPSVLTVIFVSLFLAAPIQKLPYLSQPQAIEAHYGVSGRLLLSIIILLSLTAFIASQLVAAIALLSTAAGLPHILSAFLLLAAVITYSCLGGFGMVVLTDRFHFILTTIALLVLLGQGITHTHLPHVFIHLPANSWNLTYHWPQNLLLMFTFMMAWSIAPEMWQRMAATQSAKQARQAAWLSAALLAALYGVVMLIALFAHGILPMDQPAGPVLIHLAQALPAWLQIIVLVGILSALTSTIDSSLNVASLTLTHDLIHRYVLREASEERQVRTGRYATVLIAIPAAAIALFKPSIIDMLWLSATLYASTMFIPILGLFYVPKARPLAGTLAMILGALPCIANTVAYFSSNHIAGYWCNATQTILWGISLSLLGFILGSIFPNLNKVHLNKLNENN